MIDTIHENEFSWIRPKDRNGYVWEKGKAATNSLVLVHPEQEKEGVIEGYYPFEVTPPLFLTFATTHPDEAGFAAFANQFGSIFLDPQATFQDWLLEAYYFRLFLSLAQSLETHDSDLALTALQLRP